MDKLVITIARGYGSGGLTLGRKLGEKLNLPVYDREIVRIASEQSGISEDLFGRADEHCLKLLPKVGKKGKYTGIPLGPDKGDFTSPDNLFELQAEVIRSIANFESCIIIGRAADYILKDKKGVISLYFSASEEDCIVRLRKQVSGTDEELVKRMHTIDKQRAAFYKYYTGNEWDDVHNYDLCLDTSTMSYEKLIEVVVNFINSVRNEDL